jgi:hypothetical protein
MLRANKLLIWAGMKPGKILRSPPEVGVHNEHYKTVTSQNSTCYKTLRNTKPVRFTQRYMLKNGTVNKRHVLQNSILQKNTVSGGHLELCLRAGRDGHTTTSPGGGRHGGPDWRGQ